MQGAMEIHHSWANYCKDRAVPGPHPPTTKPVAAGIKRLWQGRRSRDLGRLTRQPVVNQPSFLVFFNLISICRWRAVSGRWRPYHTVPDWPGEGVQRTHGGFTSTRMLFPGRAPPLDAAPFSSLRSPSQRGGCMSSQ